MMIWWLLRSVNQTAPEKGCHKPRASSATRRSADKKLEDAPDTTPRQYLWGRNPTYISNTTGKTPALRLSVMTVKC